MIGFVLKTTVLLFSEIKSQEPPFVLTQLASDAFLYAHTQRCPESVYAHF